MELNTTRRQKGTQGQLNAKVGFDSIFKKAVSLWVMKSILQ